MGEWLPLRGSTHSPPLTQCCNWSCCKKKISNELASFSSQIHACAFYFPQDPLLKGQRCVILADGFYEWRRQQKDKQPFFIYFPQNHADKQERKMKNEKECEEETEVKKLKLSCWGGCHKCYICRGDIIYSSAVAYTDFDPFLFNGKTRDTHIKLSEGEKDVGWEGSMRFRQCIHKAWSCETMVMNRREKTV